MSNIVWQFSGRQISFEQIKSGKFPDAMSPFEIAALEFGHSWLNGVASFAVSTSGSTGSPKQISIHREQMESSARLSERALQLKTGSTALLCLDPRHIAGKMMLVRSLVTGMSIVAVEPTANPLQAIPKNISIDFAALVPYQMRAILNTSSKKKLNAINTIIVGGATINESLKAQIAKLKCQVYATYGMTETISHIALQKLNGPGQQNYFHVLPGIHIQKDERGCLTIWADHLGRETIITNDLVDMMSPQHFRWLGRIDNVINSGGIKVIPEKIEKIVESVLLELELQNRFFIAAIDDPKLGNKVILVIEGAPLENGFEQLIYNSLNKRLGQYEKPREIRMANRFIETNTQKIDRKATLQLISTIRDTSQ